MERLDIGQRIADRYDITRVITHLSVYVGADIVTKEEVALKLNSYIDRHRSEAAFYDAIAHLEGFPKCIGAWANGD
ncbi:hypothetical protein L202_07564 [Cryptococcus amylolentus CBS 6039]|uniref:Uncharacterized protein n=2 Tax=Cryptococcus amylolentus TaxID=104669 RepID=A0A1E3HCQ1_9TREE|nr:hypothetical protein L202_07564 [Cryptococcus amylolentus CBS 6039]ODN74104.1 hypothetical protein L202_07564 [Cryptococcus amylolentus CBS 6039]ODO00111.1 hypothetical protein I350_06736 [Cryptococcus amylolentus CBS 6273]